MGPVLIHHSASRGGLQPPGSIAGLKACLASRAQIIEVDISLTFGGDFALLHGPDLEGETNGSGPVAARSANEIASLRRFWHGSLTDEPVGMLGEALSLVQDHPYPVELQLDLKPDVFLDRETLSRLALRLSPVRDRVRVTSVADWALRQLRALDSDLRLGFDPVLYLAVPKVGESRFTVPPFRVGAYGYRDEHPLSSRRWGEPAAYVEARAESLWAQAPEGVAWYVSARLLEQALNDGFDWIAFLHDRGSQVAAWTLEPSEPGEVALAQRLVAAGIDMITTSDAPGLLSVLDAQASA